MNTSNMQLTKDLPNKKITISRMFDATPDVVWRAWTESELLDQWWAPQPWKAETKSHDFRVGGHWLYAMVGPNGEKHWARLDYTSIDAPHSYESKDSFCDENGKLNPDLPEMQWKNEFLPTATGTKVIVTILFNNESDILKIVEMGFEQGFEAALENLDHYFSTRFKLQQEYKRTNQPRVSTYLNFPGKTEEAFNFYKKVFGGEFSSVKLKRFGDFEMPAELPPLSEADKKLIIHAELTIFGGHVLMATDSPESMGFKMEQGNNMHINLEPDSREETKRLFDALSERGNVTMPLSDMFWGAYFGSFTDRYGINWMLNYQAR